MFEKSYGMMSDALFRLKTGKNSLTEEEHISLITALNVTKGEKSRKLKKILVEHRRGNNKKVSTILSRMTHGEENELLNWAVDAALAVKEQLTGEKPPTKTFGKPGFQFSISRGPTKAKVKDSIGKIEIDLTALEKARKKLWKAHGEAIVKTVPPSGSITIPDFKYKPKKG